MIPHWLDPTSALSNPVTAGALVLSGVIVGTVSGLFGIGGGFLLTPILMEIFGIPGRFAVGSTSCHAVGIAATALRRHLRIGKVNYRLGFGIAAAAAMGSICGSTILSQLNRHWSTPDQQVYFGITIRIVIIVTLCCVAILIARGRKPDAAAPILQRIKIGPIQPVPGQEDKTFSIPGVMMLAFLCGIVAGFLGIGGGVVYLPMLMLAVGIRHTNAVRISLIIVLCSATGATVVHASAGNVNLTISILLIMGSSLGVQLGAFICQKIHSDRFRRYFALIVLATIALVTWKLFRQIL